jgi:probable rRNA maturation factor
VTEPDLTVEAQTAEGVRAPVPLDRIEAVVRFVLRREAIASAEISVTLLDDAGITRLNEEHLEHEGPTDVISFPLEGPGDRIVGDLYVGVDQAGRQAAEVGVTLDEELLRLAIHGTLHVLGHDHPKDGPAEDAPMCRLQEEYLAAFVRGEADR